MNLEVLKRTRSVPKVGQVFVMMPPDKKYLFGRLISDSARIGPSKGPGEECYLIYIYSVRSSQKIQVPELTVDGLLVPPLLTNRQPWLKGYFEPVAEPPLEDGDRLTAHCFERDWTTKPQFFDELGNRLTQRTEPCGQFGLQSYRTIDDLVSEALGFPLAP